MIQFYTVDDLFNVISIIPEEVSYFYKNTNTFNRVYFDSNRDDVEKLFKEFLDEFGSYYLDGAELTEGHLHIVIRTEVPV